MSNVSFDFTGQTVLVTGAARGIGLEVARHFSECGAVVYVIDFDGDEAEKAAASIGGRFVQADVSVSADVDAAVAQTFELPCVEIDIFNPPRETMIEHAQSQVAGSRVQGVKGA
ncbi:hypothetical protein BH09ACT10_BH09ACT10_13920 [soil metagenome]